MLFWMILISAIGLLICSGASKGVELITKIAMSSLLVIMVVLVARAVTLPGAMDGLSSIFFRILERWQKRNQRSGYSPPWDRPSLSLSVGAGSLAIFGSYIGKERSLAGEAVSITALDTFVAVVAGLIIFPACFAFGVNRDKAGPGVRDASQCIPRDGGGKAVGTLFFLFMTFAALSTIVASVPETLSSMDVICGDGP